MHLVLSLALLCSASQSEDPFDILSLGLVYQTPEMAKVSVERDVSYRAGDARCTFDVYRPINFKKGQKRPTIVFPNWIGDAPSGDAHTGGRMQKTWAVYQDWGRLAAASGFVGIVASSRGEAKPDDRSALFAHLREKGGDLGIDADRIGTFAESAHVGQALPALMTESFPGVKCAVLYYGGGALPAVRADLPILYVLAEKDNPGNNASIRQIWQEADRQHAPWSKVTAPTLPHAFESMANTDECRAIVAQTIEFFRSHLMPLPAAVPASRARELNALMFGQEFDKAIPILEEMVAKGEAGPRGRGMLLNCYEKAGNRAKGIPLARALVAEGNLGENEAYIQSVLGLMLAQNREYAEAETHLQRAIALYDGDSQSHYWLGYCQLMANKNAEARISLQKSHDLYPNPLAAYNLACACARLGDKTAALDALEMAVREGLRNRAATEADEDMKPLLGEARFKEIMDRMGPAGGGSGTGGTGS